MGYILLTGATGLLGSYLLRDGLLAERQLAVLVRPGKRHNARHRVETILSFWESITGKLLPRPVVLEGDLGEADLGLDASRMRWVAENCTSIVHSAASLSFRSGDRNAEPWVTNVGGTRRVLDFCRHTGIREFHHVSTAYVCGLRTGRVFESELDVGQAFGNDYEKSKVEAETMVREADFLGPVTVYRPAILIGDSRTGYTTTFHGFFALLRMAHTLVSRLVRGATGAHEVLDALGLVGGEHKNFIPVDWVSAVMTHILGQPELFGKTYHLTTPRPISVARIAGLVQHAVETYSTLASETDESRCDAEWFSLNFRTEMDVYRSYWRDDPQFDDANTVAAAPHLPCPAVDDAMLLRMAKYAIDSNFGKAARRPAKPASGVAQYQRVP